jgi:hypothetical protein
MKWGFAPNPIRSFGFAELVIPHPRDSSVLLLAQNMGRCPKPQLLFCLDTKK